MDVGARNGLTAGEFVVESTTGISKNHPMLDVGGDVGAEAGRLVLAGRHIWGKLAAVGAATSTVQRLTDPNYRDRVQLTHGAGETIRLGARGMLVGTGEAHCRIDLIEAAEPVAVGDDVYAASDGTLREPLYYGRIVRAEHAAGQPHWRLWMEPAIGDDEPREAIVLKFELNPARMASRTSSVQLSARR